MSIALQNEKNTHSSSTTSSLSSEYDWEEEMAQNYLDDSPDISQLLPDTQTKLSNNSACDLAHNLKSHSEERSCPLPALDNISIPDKSSSSYTEKKRYSRKTIASDTDRTDKPSKHTIYVKNFQYSADEIRIDHDNCIIQ